MNLVVGDFEGCSVCLDDKIVYSNEWDVHFLHIQKSFDRLAHKNLTINLAKCEFAIVVFLGRSVGQGIVCAPKCKLLMIMTHQ